jgi:hypothetical protein
VVCKNKRNITGDVPAKARKKAKKKEKGKMLRSAKELVALTFG